MNSVSIAPSTIDVANVDAARPELARHALRERAQCMLRAREGGEVRRAAQARRGAGVEDRAPAARDHAFGDFAAVQEAAQASHLPDLEVLARGFFQDAARHVGADVEDQHLDRADVALDRLDERDHVFFLARVRAIAVGTASGARDVLEQRLQLVGFAPRHAGGEPPRAKRRAIAPPVASPAPMTSATAVES